MLQVHITLCVARVSGTGPERYSRWSHAEERMFTRESAFPRFVYTSEGGVRVVVENMRAVLR